MITNQPQRFESGMDGAAPDMWFGKDAPDGDRGPWAQAPIGSVYIQKTSAGPKHWIKYAANGRDDDWAQGVHIIEERVTRAQFTDGGSTSGTKALTQKIPAGAIVLQAVLLDVKGFTGDTSATITIGDGTDVDRYNTGTPSVFADAAVLDVGVPSGTKVHTAEKTVTCTVTSGADFTNCTAGSFTVRIYLLN